MAIASQSIILRGDTFNYQFSIVNCQFGKANGQWLIAQSFPFSVFRFPFSVG